jgi:hypothetical protein
MSALLKSGCRIKDFNYSAAKVEETGMYVYVCVCIETNLE